MNAILLLPFVGSVLLTWCPFVSVDVCSVCFTILVQSVDSRSNDVYKELSSVGEVPIELFSVMLFWFPRVVCALVPTTCMAIAEVSSVLANSPTTVVTPIVVRTGVGEERSL